MERELLSVLVFHYSRVKINKIEEQTFLNSIKDKATHRLKDFHIVGGFDVVPSTALAVGKNSNVTSKIDRIINLIHADI